MGEGWPGPVKCVYTLRIRSAHRICRGLETEPGCGGEGQLCVVPHRFVFLALHGRHSKTHAGHVEKSGSDQRDRGEGRKDLRTPLGNLRQLEQRDWCHPAVNFTGLEEGGGAGRAELWNRPSGPVCWNLRVSWEK